MVSPERLATALAESGLGRASSGVLPSGRRLSQGQDPMTAPDPSGGTHTARGTEAQAKQTRGKRIIRGFMELGITLGVGAVFYLAVEALWGGDGVTYFHAILLILWVPSLCEKYLFGYLPFGGKSHKGDKDA